MHSMYGYIHSMIGNMPYLLGCLKKLVDRQT